MPQDNSLNVTTGLGPSGSSQRAGTGLNEAFTGLWWKEKNKDSACVCLCVCMMVSCHFLKRIVGFIFVFLVLRFVGR